MLTTNDNPSIYDCHNHVYLSDSPLILEHTTHGQSKTHLWGQLTESYMTLNPYNFYRLSRIGMIIIAINCENVTVWIIWKISCLQIAICNLKTIVIAYPSVSNLKSPNIIGPINSFLIDHASYHFTGRRRGEEGGGQSKISSEYQIILLPYM